MTQNRTFSRSLLDHFFFLKNVKCCVFQVFTKFKNQIQIPALQSEPISGKHKTFSFLFFCLNETDPRFAKDTWAQIRCLLFFHSFSRKSDYFMPSFASVKSVIFLKKTQMLITTDTFCFCTYKSVLLVRLTSVVGWKMRRLARRSVGH